MPTTPAQLGTVIGCRLDKDRGSNPDWSTVFPFAILHAPFLGPIQASISMNTVGVLSGVKRSKLNADYTPPSNAEVKNARYCTSTPL
jgi:hypothetical protein